MTFAEQLRDAMEGRTQEQTAQESGVAQTTISRLLSGEGTPNYRTLMRLEKALPRLRKLRANGAVQISG